MRDESDGAEPDWVAFREAYRRKLRRRLSAGVALVIAAVGLFVITVRVLGPQDYPPGDIRNDGLFRLAMASFFLVLIAFVVVGTSRALWRGERD